ncbi:copper amine oxidase N-terminal domain-containing protein [Desulforamulus aquiferis]|uniref:Copper amine oxidase N-terminal domain-containing protein n=1 Tax=Desulforamulus aquiferis TaxID=1397668 RepID=A0AAW7Z742_9FIRM|nr:copper amine oxidase N-terminal domain-containing protein [Desulforamulus aquiferis]MDO7785792.1 copper amine oxidase N-terminal domain-containing protein [Desulforamulus aquiferis]
MRKLITVLMICCFVLGLTTGALAEQVDVYDQNKDLVKSVVFIEGRSEYFVNGQTPGVKMDVAPYIAQDRTFVPVRYLGNALGVANEHIYWDSTTNKAKLVLGNNSTELTIGQKQIVVNGLSLGIDVAPELQSGRTFLPARFVAEALGYQVDFVDGLVVCYPKGMEKPDLSAVKQYLGQQVPQGETYNLNGYTVPKNPETEILISNSKINNVEIKLGIIVNGYVNGVLMHNRDVAKQCDEAEQILASKLGANLAKQVVDVARTKTTQKVRLEKDFTGPNGEVVQITSGWGDTTTGITVWSKGA